MPRTRSLAWSELKIGIMAVLSGPQAVLGGQLIGASERR